MKKQAEIAVILVGYNSRCYLFECLESLRLVDWGKYSHHVVYVDNASTDNSAEMVRHQWPNATIIANKRNLGFSKACNQGAAVCDSRYIYLLNVDTVLYHDSIRLLAEFLDSHPRAGAVGNRLLNGDRTDQWSARRFPTWRNALLGRRTWLGRKFGNSEMMRNYTYRDQMAGEEPFAVDWIPGSCTLVRSEAYRQVAGLPEEMHYWSDAVFCDRLRRSGWDVFVVPKAKLIHFEGNGTGVKTGAARRWLITDFHRGAYRFYCEHYNLRRGSPLRWAAKIGLALRAGLLVSAEWVRHAGRLGQVLRNQG